MGPEIAWAEPPRARLRQLVIDANRAYQARRYADALDLYQRAWSLHQYPPLLYRLGQTREKLGDLSGAARDYEAYLGLATNNPHAPKIRAHIQRLRAKKETRLSGLHIVTDPPGATVWLDGKRLSQRTPAKLKLPARTYRLKLTMEGKKPVEAQVSIPAQRFTRRNYVLSDQAPTPVKEPEPKEDVKPEPERKKPKGPEPYVLTRVNLSPPPLLNGLAWTLAIGGMISTVLGVAICTYDCNDMDDVLPLLLGVGALGGGSYLLFFQDWTWQLPEAHGSRREPSVGVGLKVPF